MDKGSWIKKFEEANTTVLKCAVNDILYREKAKDLATAVAAILNASLNNDHEEVSTLLSGNYIFFTASYREVKSFKVCNKVVESLSLLGFAEDEWESHDYPDMKNRDLKNNLDGVHVTLSMYAGQDSNCRVETHEETVVNTVSKLVCEE